MRGPDIQQDTLFSTASPESRVPKDHPLRPIRTMVDQALAKLDADFNDLYSDFGRDSILPEKLLRVQLLMALYTIRSEQQLVEQINYNLLFRWFVGFSMDDEVWNHSTFTKSRDRLLGGEIAGRFFAQVLGQAEQADLLSKAHFSVDGTMIEALASLKTAVRRMKTNHQKVAAAILMSTLRDRNAAGIPTNPKPTKTPICTRRARGRPPSSATSAIF